jgi:hypothetical protein
VTRLSDKPSKRPSRNCEHHFDAMSRETLQSCATRMSCCAGRYLGANYAQQRRETERNAAERDILTPSK